MSLTIQHALDIGAALRSEDLMIDIPGKGQHFDKDHVKSLSPADRKICYKALSVIERAQLNSFNSETKTSAVDLTDRVRKVTEAINTELPTDKTKKSPWYKRPFIWIAKLINSLILCFKNTFLGRISSNKLLNKVETYLNDYRNGHIRIEVLNRRDTGLVHTAKAKLGEEAVEQKKFLLSFKVLVEARDVLHLVDTIAAKECKSKAKGLENLRSDIQSTWIIDGINSDVIPTSDFKAVVVKQIESSTQEVQTYLDDLFEAAKSDDENSEIVADLFEAAVEKLKSDFERKTKEGSNLHSLVKEAHVNHKKLADELDLLTKKYPL